MYANTELEFFYKCWPGYIGTDGKGYGKPG